MEIVLAGEHVRGGIRSWVARQDLSEASYSVRWYNASARLTISGEAESEKAKSRKPNARILKNTIYLYLNISYGPGTASNLLHQRGQRSKSLSGGADAEGAD